MPQASSTLQDVYSVLSVDATLIGLVADRIFPNVAPQDTALPFIVTELVSSSPNYCVDGGPNAGDTDTVQISCYAATGDGASDMADRVIAILNEYTSGAQTQEFTMDDDQSGGSISDNNADDRVHWRFLTFSGITK